MCEELIQTSKKILNVEQKIMFFLKSIRHAKHLTFHGQMIEDINGQFLEIKTQLSYKDIKMCSSLPIIKFK